MGSLHDGTLGGAAAILDDGHSRLGDGRLVGRHLQDLSLGFRRAFGGEVRQRGGVEVERVVPGIDRCDSEK